MEEGNSLQDTNGLDICDYMDIVTTYKCRFCSFTSTTPQGISGHVKQIHIQQPNKPEQTQTIEINNQKIPIDTTLTVDMATGCVQIQPASQSVIDDRKVRVEQAPNFDILEETFDDISVTSQAENLQAVSSIQATDTITMITVDALKSMPIPSFKTNETTDPSTDSSSTYHNTISPPTESLSVNINKDQSQERTDDTSNSTGIQTSESTSNGMLSLESNSFQPNQVLPSSDNPPITKELFLCGQCSVGYNSIEECKAHMIEDHNIEIEDTNDRNIKISVGTQVENVKRPGRKKKVVKEEQQEEEACPLKVEKFSDSDWEEDKEESYSRSRSRRKIRRPKALSDGYILPKVKKSNSGDEEKEEIPPEAKRVRKQKVEMKEKYEEKCSVVGCYAKFRTKESLEIHSKCHVVRSKTFICLKCEEKFPNWRTVRFHLWKVHKVDTDLLECDICHEFKADTLSKLMVHKEIHSEDKPYTCHVCGKGFRQFCQMKNHQLIHNSNETDVPKAKRQCNICNRVFANTKCMQKHIEGVHSKLKPFVCSYCGYSTTRKAMLQLHERTHTKEKPFKCELCSFSSSDHNSLRRHTMRHTGKRPYHCSYCPYTCIQAISFKMHMKNKHPNATGVFCCSECTYRTVNEKFFKNHLEDHKNGLVVEKEQPPPDKIQYTIQALNDNGIQVSNEDGIHLQDIPIIELQQNVAEIETARQPIEIQIQVHTLDSGETQISAEDFSKVTNCERLSSFSTSPGQLITYALNAITQNSEPNTTTIQTVNGITVTVLSGETKDGVTSHNISFQVPGIEIQATDNQLVLESINEINEVQSLTFDDVTNESEELSEQSSTQQIVIAPQGEVVNFVSNATIDDLAQISCYVKDGTVFENAVDSSTVDINNANIS